MSHEAPLETFWRAPAPPDARLAEATLRLVAAMLHVRGSMYDPEGIDAAARGIVHRLDAGLVNVPLAEVLRG